MGMKPRSDAAQLPLAAVKAAREQGIAAATEADDVCDLDNYMDPDEPHMEPSDLCLDYWDHMQFQDEVRKVLPDMSEAQAQLAWKEFLGAFLAHCKLLYPEKAALVK